MTHKTVFITCTKEEIMQDIYWNMVKIILPFQYIKKEVLKMKGTGKNISAKVMKAVAGKSAQAAADSRCMYIYHQPKQPAGLQRTKR